MAKDADPLGNDSFSVHHNIATDLAQFFVGYFAIVIGQFNTITRNPKFGVFLASPFCRFWPNKNP